MENPRLLDEETTRIYLVGMPGSGKSTAGPLLAECLGWAFQDLDQQIESEVDLSISRIFEERGEEVFRAIETRLLHQTAALKHLVVATGGGAVLRNINWMLEQGRVVWLDPPVSELLLRLANSYHERPLFKEAGSKDLGLNVESLYHARYPSYARAHHRFPGMESLLDWGTSLREPASR